MNSCRSFSLPPPPPPTWTPIKDGYPPPLHHLGGLTHNVYLRWVPESFQRFYFKELGENYGVGEHVPIVSYIKT